MSSVVYGLAAYKLLPSQQTDIKVAANDDRQQRQQEKLQSPHRFARLSYWFAILCITALFSGSLRRNTQIRLVSDKQSFRFWVFSQQTSAGYCAGYGHCILKHIRPFWTIHGLWPTNAESWPKVCNKTINFNISVFDVIRNDLEMYWPSVRSMNSSVFWRHEWQKHGSCGLQVFHVNGMFRYFNETLSLLHTYNVTNFLIDKGIFPTINRTYTVAELYKALTDNLRSKANIVCRKVNGFAYPVLTEVRLCLSKYGLELIDCQIDSYGCGNSSVYYLPVGEGNRSRLDGLSQYIVSIFSFYVNYLSPV